MTAPVATRACQVGATLGEGPVWVARDQALWFVDIKQLKVHRFHPESGQLKTWDAPAQVGWLLPRKASGFICGLKTGLSHFDERSGLFTSLDAVEPDLPGNRLNDGTADCHGRLWFGSMDDGESQPSGHFYRADTRGIARVISGIAITNGPAVSPRGDLLYHTDTLAGVISVSPINSDGSLGSARGLIRIDPKDGYPDGPTVDAEGCIWTGLWGGWSARRYSPAGELIAAMRFPAANITKVAFGGADGRTVYATSARKGLSEAELAAQPEAGNLFKFWSDVPGQQDCLVGDIAVQHINY